MNGKVFCLLFSTLLIATLILVPAQDARACYRYTLSVGGAAYSDYDGGAEDVEYHNVSAPRWNVKLGDSHVYGIGFEYSPGCGNLYSGKWHVIQVSVPTGVTYTFKDSSGKAIDGISYVWNNTGDFHCYLQVNIPMSATVGDVVRIKARLWTNDSAACNEHNTLDAETTTIISTVTGIVDPSPQVRVDYPNGGEVWLYPYYYNAYWNAYGGNGTLKVDLEYSLSGPSGPWTMVVKKTINTGIYTIPVPNAKSNNCYFRVTVYDSSVPPQTKYDMSDAPFTIDNGGTDPTIYLASPVGGEKWTSGSTQYIQWTATGLGTPTIDLSYSTTGYSGTYTAIASGIPNTGSFAWTVPSTPSSDCWVKAIVHDTSSPPKSATDYSNHAFSIIAGTPPSITLTSPIGGEVLQAGMEFNITWTASGGNGSLAIKIEYSTSGSTGPWQLISAGESNDGRYEWVVPSASSADCYVKVTASDSSIPPADSSDMSASGFTIEQTPHVPDINGSMTAVCCIVLASIFFIVVRRRLK